LEPRRNPALTGSGRSETAWSDHRNGQTTYWKKTDLWDLLGEYESWISTAPKSADKSRLETFSAKPILVLTEDSDAQEKVFYDEVPVGARLRVFGSAHTNRIPGETQAERWHMAATPAQQPDSLALPAPK